MMYHKHVFDDLPEVGEIELDLKYTYSFTPGRYDGPPESCYPDEEDMEIIPPEGYEETIIAAYMKAAREAIKAIDSKISDLEFDNMPRKWAAEERIIP